MNSLKILGITQVVVALVFVIIAGRTVPDAPGWAKQFAKTSRALAAVTASHRETYRQSAQNIFSIRAALGDMSGKTMQTASAIRSTGEAFQERKGSWYYPDALVRLGVSLQEIGQDFSAVAAATEKQAEILQQYEKSVYPQTVEVFDEAVKSFELSAKTLDAVSDDSSTNLLVLSLLAGVFFLLNGAALIWLGFRIDGRKTETV